MRWTQASTQVHTRMHAASWAQTQARTMETSPCQKETKELQVASQAVAQPSSGDEEAGSRAQRDPNISREILLHRKSLLRLPACQGVISH